VNSSTVQYATMSYDHCYPLVNDQLADNYVSSGLLVNILLVYYLHK